MNPASCNCIVCAQEFDPSELQSVVLSKINMTNYKVCQACFNSADPSEDYNEVRKIVNSYLKLSQAKHYFNEVKDILNSIDES